MKKIVTPAAGIVSLGLIVAFSNGCGQGVSQGSADTKTAAAVPDSAKDSVGVKLTEYKIEMPASVSAGATTFTVTNTGKETHGFEIEGNGIEKALKPRLKKGESGSFQVDWNPATSTVYGPVL